MIIIVINDDYSEYEVCLDKEEAEQIINDWVNGGTASDEIRVYTAEEVSFELKKVVAQIHLPLKVGGR